MSWVGRGSRVIDSLKPRLRVEVTDASPCVCGISLIVGVCNELAIRTFLHFLNTVFSKQQYNKGTGCARSLSCIYLHIKASDHSLLRHSICRWWCSTVWDGLFLGMGKIALVMPFHLIIKKYSRILSYVSPQITHIILLSFLDVNINSNLRRIFNAIIQNKCIDVT